MNKQQNKQKLQTTHIYINISCKCDTNRAGHLTLDAYASRPVACLSLGQMMACRLVDTKPLPERMVEIVNRAPRKKHR